MFRVDPLPIIKTTKLYLQHLVFLKPLLLAAAILEELRQVAVAVWQIPVTVDTFLCSCWWVGNPPETCRALYRKKKLFNFAFSWLYFGTYLRCTNPWTTYLLILNNHIKIQGAENTATTFKNHRTPSAAFLECGPWWVVAPDVLCSCDFYCDSRTSPHPSFL